MAKPGRIIRATLIELWSRVTDFNKSEKVFWNGHNNLYPNEIERVVMNSPTARRAQRMMAKFIEGKGVINDVKVNKKKDYNLSDLVSLMADDISIHYGFWLHAGGFSIDDQGMIKPTSWDVLDYSRCRIGKEDDEGNHGMILYRDYEKTKNRFGSNSDNDKEISFFPFTTDQSVIKENIKALAKDQDLNFEDALKRFKGQVLYVNLTPRYRYAISPFDSVFNDCDTEYRIGLYDNTMTRGGFLGKTAVLTQGLDDEAANQIKEDIGKWLGAENSSSIYHLDVEQAESLDNVLKIIQVESQYDDDMFDKLQTRIRRNILGAANNIPEALAFSDATLFGTSGESYEQMKIFYSEQTEGERLEIDKVLKLIGDGNSQIIPFVNLSEVEIVSDEEPKMIQ